MLPSARAGVKGNWAYPWLDCASLRTPDFHRLWPWLDRTNHSPVIRLEALDRLADEDLANALLAQINARPQYSWLATLERPERVHELLRAAFTWEVETTPPGPEEFAGFLSSRCREWEIVHTWDQVWDLVDAAEGSFRKALDVLAAAADADGVLTDQLIGSLSDRQEA
jgi:hypothetical protein